MKKNVLLLAGLMMLSGCGKENEPISDSQYSETNPVSNEYTEPIIETIDNKETVTTEALPNNIELTIKNFSKYKKIGIAKENTISNQNVSNRKYANNTLDDTGTKQNPYKLIGYDEAGDPSVLKLSEMNGDLSVVNTFGIIGFRDVGNFLFLVFSQNYVDRKIVTQNYLRYGDVHSHKIPEPLYHAGDGLFLMLSKKTGNLYPCCLEYSDQNTNCVLYSDDMLSSGDTLFVREYKMSEENGKIKVVQNPKLSTLNLYAVDIYGNAAYWGNGSFYLAKNDNSIVNEYYEIGIDGRFYSNDHFIDENGEPVLLEKPTMVGIMFGPLINFCCWDKQIIDNCIVYKKDNISYYIGPGDMHIKFTLQSDGTYLSKQIDNFTDGFFPFSETSMLDDMCMYKQYMIANRSSWIFLVDFEDESYKEILKEYNSKKDIFYDRNGHIYFTGKDSELNDVTGCYNIDDGTVDVNVTAPDEITITYIEPLA